MSSIEMPGAPTGTRWFAKPGSEGWIVLYLGPAEWTDDQIQHPDLKFLYSWPNSLPGLCGGEPARAVSMAHQLIARFHERFPAVGSASSVADAINSGTPFAIERGDFDEKEAS